MLGILDYLSVLIYGVLIMVFFLDIKINRKNMVLVLAYVLIGGFLQFGFYYAYGSKTVEKLYPLIIHLPIVIFFCYVFEERLNLVLFVLFTSYIFTAPRRWVGEVIAPFFNNDPYIFVITKVITSIILLVIIYKYLRPYVNRILKYSSSRITLLTVIPALSYFTTYATTVYTDALYNSNMLVVGLFSIGFNCMFYIFIIAYFIEMDKGFELKTEQSLLQMQIDTTLVKIDEYKKSQKQGDIYRHDLRHHLQYLSVCIKEDHKEDALKYIAEINKNVDDMHVTEYCENTSVNLILSAYGTKAKNNNIDIEIKAIVPMVIPIHATDISIILANGIENAIHACSKLKNENDRKIKVCCNIKNKIMMIEISNSFGGDIQFEEDIPISLEKNHGLGVKSIVATVKKYHGIYSFAEENGIFKVKIIF